MIQQTIELPDEISQQLKSVGDLPTLPKVATEVMNLVKSGDTAFKDLAKVIEKDPGFTVSLLRVSNSPLYRTRSKSDAGTVLQALTLLGANEVQRICLSLGVQAAFPVTSDKDRLDRKRFWWHSSACAVIARRLVSEFGLKTDGEEFTAGMLHDIGKLVLDMYFPERYKSIVNQTFEEGVSLKEAERQHLGTDHSELGAWLCIQWGFPAELTNAIHFHHQPELAAADARLLPAIINLSDTFARVTGNAFSGETTPVDICTLPSWKMICEVSENCDQIDLAGLTFHIEEDIKQCSELVAGL